MAEGATNDRPLPIEHTSLAPASVNPRPASHRRISLGAVVIGVLVALVAQVLLGLLGVALGAAGLEAARGAGAFRVGAGLWWVASGLVALFAGGWVAAKLAGPSRRRYGSLHGILTWGITTLFSLYLMTTSAGGLVAGPWASMNRGVSMDGDGQRIAFVDEPGATPETAERLNLEGLRIEIRRLLQQSTGESATGSLSQSEAEVLVVAQALLDPSPEVADTAKGREDVVTALVGRAAMSREEAERTVADWERIYRASGPATVGMAEPEEAQASGFMGYAVAGAVIWTLVALIATAIAAVLGGKVGSRFSPSSGLPSARAGLPRTADVGSA